MGKDFWRQAWCALFTSQELVIWTKFSDNGSVIDCTQVVICTGTFLSGEIHIGESNLTSTTQQGSIFIGLQRFPAGRINEAPSLGLSASLNAAGFKLRRLQTGTPARLDGKTINFANLDRQDGDASPSPFSFLNSTVDNAVNQIPCFKTNTTAATHQIVKDNLHNCVHIQETKKGPSYLLF